MRNMTAAANPAPPISQLRRGAIEFCVLALLDQQEAYGFELVRRLATMEGMVASEGTIYPLLARLRRADLVSTSWKESASGPPRRYYRTTASGRQSLRAFEQEWRKFRKSVDSLLSPEGTTHE